MYGQEPIRKLLKQYCKEKGVKYIYIANQLKLSKSTICHFTKNDRDMRKNNFNKVVAFLKNADYL